MAQSKKYKERQLLGQYVRHPIQSVKIMLAVKQATDQQLLAIWHACGKELKKRGVN